MFQMSLNTSILSPGTGPVHAAGAPQDNTASDLEFSTMYHKLYRPSGTYDGGPRGPHPGDVIYWIACLGAAVLLILAAT